MAEPAHDVIAANGRDNVRVLAPHRLALRVFPFGSETFVDESCEFSCVSLVRALSRARARRLIARTRAMIRPDARMSIGRGFIRSA